MRKVKIINDEREVDILEERINTFISENGYELINVTIAPYEAGMKQIFTYYTTCIIYDDKK